ncbi:MAG: hypothetical protein QXG65_04005 [Thermoplasmata archaeon]
MAPQSTLDWHRVVARLGEPLPRPRLESLLFGSKAEMIDLSSAGALQLSVTPDRLDLLSEGGLALALEGMLGTAAGVPPIRIHSPSPLHGTAAPALQVDPSVDPLRPSIAAVIVHAPRGGIDEGTLAEAIRMQELVHASVGRDRRSASLGLYAVRRIRFPLRYALEPLADVEFVPLDGDRPIRADRFFEEHPMAGRYGALGRAGGRCLVLRDADGRIASLPPVLNGRDCGEVRPGDGPLLVEATGRSVRPVAEALASLLVVFASQGYSVESVPILDPIPSARPPAHIAERRVVEVADGTIERIAGASPVPEEVVRWAGVARLDAERVPGGFRVAAAPWRIDLLGPVDVVEDLLVARGLRVEEARPVPSWTRGRRREETRFRRRFDPVLLGLGFQPVHTPVLVAEEAVARAGRQAAAIPLANPTSREFSWLRPALIVSLMETLRRNRRVSYPQRVSESGPVVVRSARAESGAATRHHLAVAVAGDGTGFADLAGIADALVRSADVVAVRVPAAIPGTIAGRAAELTLTSEAVGEVAEVDPLWLEAVGIPVPVAYAELDLTALEGLVAGRPPAAEGPAGRTDGGPARRDTI